MAATVAQQHGLPVTKTDLATAAAESQMCQRQGPTLSPGLGAIPEITTELPGEMTTEPPGEMTTEPPGEMTIEQPVHIGLCPPWYPALLRHTKGLISQPKECDHGHTVMELSGHTVVPSSALGRRSDGANAGGRNMDGWGRMWVSDQSEGSTISPNTQDAWVQGVEGGEGLAPPTIAPRDLLESLSFQCPCPQVPLSEFWVWNRKCTSALLRPRPAQTPPCSFWAPNAPGAMG